MQSKLLKKLFFIAMSLGFLSAAVPAQAVAVYVNVPVDREVIAPPGGYQECYVVPSGYDNGYYIHAHRVCNYVDSPYGGAWVGGFWQCPYYHHGVCGGAWVWNPSHWAQYGGPEYGVRWHDAAWYHGGPRYGHDYDRGYQHGGYYRDGHHGHGGHGR